MLLISGRQTLYVVENRFCIPKLPFCLFYYPSISIVYACVMTCASVLVRVQNRHVMDYICFKLIIIAGPVSAQFTSLSKVLQLQVTSRRRRLRGPLTNIAVLDLCLPLMISANDRPTSRTFLLEAFPSSPRLVLWLGQKYQSGRGTTITFSLDTDSERIVFICDCTGPPSILFFSFFLLFPNI
jgi:hypothetical protein